MNPIDNINQSQTQQSSTIVLVKIGSLIMILLISLVFGYFPMVWQKCRTSTKFLGIANAFSGGIFMSIALFHLLPESNERFDSYFQSNPSQWQSVPFGYFICFLSYGLILFIEKVAFDSHALIDHEHSENEHDGENENYFEDKHHNHEKLKEPHFHHTSHKHHNQQLNEAEYQLEKEKIEKFVLKDMINQSHFSEDERHKLHFNSKINEREKECLTDEEEQAIKNVVSSKGKYASFLHVRNIMQGTGDVQIDKGLMTATKIMSMSRHSNEDIDILSHNQGVTAKELCQKLNDDNDQTETNHHHFVPKSSLTPYILLIALSFHGFFEGIALGIQSNVQSTTFLTIAILSHKWAESFTLGISFSKAKTEYSTFVKLIVLFSIFTPAGIVLGILITGSNELIEGIFLALSTGTFLYVSASEVIVEEFAITKYRYEKYIFFMIGAILMGFLKVLENLKNV